MLINFSEGVNQQKNYILFKITCIHKFLATHLKIYSDNNQNPIEITSSSFLFGASYKQKQRQARHFVKIKIFTIRYLKAIECLAKNFKLGAVNDP